MPVAVFILPILAAAAPASGPVVVTGYAWAPFISPMGEAFRAHSATDDTLADWFRQADTNHDGMLTVGEMQADADRFFDTLDIDRNGEIEPEELVRYEWQLAPEIQVNTKRRRPRGEPPPAGTGLGERDDGVSGGRKEKREREGDSPQGAARYALLNLPEPVAAADADFNRAISKAEFRQAAIERFQLLDRQRQGQLTLEALRPLLPGPPTKSRQKRDKDAPDVRIGSPLPPGP